MLPGSRRSEISHMLVPMLDALMLVGKAMPGLTVSLPTLPHLADQLREGVAAAVAKGNLQDVIAINTGKDALFDALSKSHAVLAASGTVTLQTALYGVPGVACYKASAISAFIGRRLVQMDKVILPNTLLANTLSGDAREKDQVYPFLFQEKATPQAMAEALLGSLADPQAESRAADHAQKLRKMLRGEQDNDSANRGFEANIVHAMTRWLGTPSPRFDA
jgi:lipid-A-disaccharide synthase